MERSQFAESRPGVDQAGSKGHRRQDKESMGLERRILHLGSYGYVSFILDSQCLCHYTHHAKSESEERDEGDAGRHGESYPAGAGSGDDHLWDSGG